MELQKVHAEKSALQQINQALQTQLQKKIEASVLSARAVLTLAELKERKIFVKNIQSLGDCV